MFPGRKSWDDFSFSWLSVKDLSWLGAGGQISASVSIVYCFNHFLLKPHRRLSADHYDHADHEKHCERLRRSVHDNFIKESRVKERYPAPHALVNPSDKTP
jgi:hypothetical protein